MSDIDEALVAAIDAREARNVTLAIARSLMKDLKQLAEALRDEAEKSERCAGHLANPTNQKLRSDRDLAQMRAGVIESLVAEVDEP